jgi:hypothetical protein
MLAGYQNLAVFEVLLPGLHFFTALPMAFMLLSGCEVFSDYSSGTLTPILH